MDMSNNSSKKKHVILIVFLVLFAIFIALVIALVIASVASMAWKPRLGTATRIYADGFQVQYVAFSPDGRWLAAGVNGNMPQSVTLPLRGQIYLYEAATLKLVRTHTFSTWVTSISFSPDSSILAVGSGSPRTLASSRPEVDPAANGELHLLSIDQLQPRSRFVSTILDSQVVMLAFHPTTDWLYGIVRSAISGPGEVRRWAVSGVGKSEVLNQRSSGFSALAMSKDGKTLYAGYGWKQEEENIGGGAVDILSSDSGQILTTIDKKIKNKPLSFAFIPHTDFLVMGMSGDKAVINLSTNQLVDFPDIEPMLGGVRAVEISPDGRWYSTYGHVSGSDDYAYSVLKDQTTGQKTKHREGNISLNCTAFSPDSKTWVVAGVDHSTAILIFRKLP